MSKITNDGLTRSCTGCFVSCTHMATVGHGQMVNVSACQGDIVVCMTSVRRSWRWKRQRRGSRPGWGGCWCEAASPLAVNRPRTRQAPVMLMKMMLGKCDDAAAQRCNSCWCCTARCCAVKLPPLYRFHLSYRLACVAVLNCMWALRVHSFACLRGLGYFDV